MSDPHKNGVITIISVVTIIAGVIVMCGWIFHVPVLKEIVPGFVPMVFNAAVVCEVTFPLGDSDMPGYLRSKNTIQISTDFSYQSKSAALPIG